MKISRWRADKKPSLEEVEGLFKSDGLEYVVEEHNEGSEVREHKHPFDEVRVVVKGAMRFNVAGNEFILHEGDRLELPSNTRHWTRVEPGTPCLSVFAHRVS